MSSRQQMINGSPSMNNDHAMVNPSSQMISPHHTQINGTGIYNGSRVEHAQYPVSGANPGGYPSHSAEVID